MTPEQKQLLLSVLCAMLPHGVIGTDSLHGDSRITNIDITNPDDDSDVLVYYYDFDEFGRLEDCKPYLRPMSSMTEEEYKELKKISPYYGLSPFECIDEWRPNYEMINWLYAHYLDPLGLIPMGLALKAPAGMYKIK